MCSVPQPISEEQADTLYEAIFTALGGGTKSLVEDCDHTLRLANSWAEQNGVDVATLTAWLHDNGGFCDCEFLFNVMPDDEEEPNE